MLRYRLFLGTLFIAALAGLCWLDGTRAWGAPPGAWLFPLALLLCFVASDELLMLLAKYRPARVLVHVGNLVIVAAVAPALFPVDPLDPRQCPDLGWTFIAFVLLALAVFVWEISQYEPPGKATSSLAVTIFCMFYVGLLMSFVVRLRALRGTGDEGLLALISLIVVVKMGDSGAYTVGRLIGRHKLAPRVSPGKTWEGAAGAILFAVLGSWAVFGWLGPWLHPGRPSLEPWRWIAYGLIVGMAGLLGDLAESLLKRDAGCKDSSPWMPGFGGMLDLLDSILFAAPVAYLCWAVGLLH